MPWYPRLDSIIVLHVFLVVMEMAGRHVTVLSCPAQCACTPGQHRIRVHCAGRNFTKMPEFPRTMSLELLNLSSNAISVLPMGSFRDPEHLQVFYLEHCHLVDMDRRALAGMSSLRILRLGGNQLSQLHSGVFNDVSSLEELVLADNQIQTLPSDLFALTRKLRVLDLSSNRLQAVPIAIKDVSSLTTLNLSHNTITKLGEGDFGSLSSLQEIYLANTSLDSVPAAAFRDLTSLRQLDLSRNSLVTIESALVEGLTLTGPGVVDLGGNPLVCDCRLLQVHQWMETHSLVIHAECDLPKTLTGTRFLDVRPELLTCHKGARTNATPEDPSAERRTRTDDGQELYNPMLGWYTAATLSAMLMGFLLCVTLDRVKRKLCQHIRRKKRRREILKLQEAEKNAEQNDMEMALVARSEPFKPQPVALPERRNSNNERTTAALEKNNILSRVPSVKNRPTLTLTLPESNNELELQNCLKKVDSRHGNMTVTIQLETPPKTAFRIHPNCPVHSPNGAARIPRMEELESRL